MSGFDKEPLYKIVEKEKLMSASIIVMYLLLAYYACMYHN